MIHISPTTYRPETFPPTGRSQLARCPSPLFNETLTLQQLPPASFFDFTLHTAPTSASSPNWK